MNRYTRRRHISSFVITSPNPRIGNENGVVIIEDERLQKNEAFKFIYYILMFLLLILSPFPLLTLAWNNYMFSMFSHCVYMLLYRYAAYEGSILWIEKLYICWNLFLLWAWYRFVTYLFYVFARIRTPDANICYYYFLILSSGVTISLDVKQLFICMSSEPYPIHRFIFNCSVSRCNNCCSNKINAGLMHTRKKVGWHKSMFRKIWSPFLGYYV